MAIEYEPWGARWVPSPSWKKNVAPHTSTVCQCHPSLVQLANVSFKHLELGTLGYTRKKWEEMLCKANSHCRASKQLTVLIQFRIDLRIFSSFATDISAGLSCYSVAVGLYLPLHQGQSIPKSHLTPVYSSLAGYTKNSHNTLKNWKHPNCPTLRSYFDFSTAKTRMCS